MDKVAANPLQWKLSERPNFHRRVCSFYCRAFSFHRRKSGFISDVYLTVNIRYLKLFHVHWGSTEPSESPTKLLNNQRVQQNYSGDQLNHRRVPTKLQNNQRVQQNYSGDQLNHQRVQQN